MIQPPSSGPTTGATSIVIAHIAIAVPALRRRVARQQQRLRQRDHRPGDQALQHAEDDQRLDVRRQAAQPRGEHEQQHAGGEQPHLAEALRQPAGQRHRDRVGDRERGDDPGALRRADAQVAGDRRDRHVGDRRVEHVHEGGQRQRQRAEHELAAVQRRRTRPAGADRLRRRGGRARRVRPGPQLSAWRRSAATAARRSTACGAPSRSAVGAMIGAPRRRPRSLVERRGSARRGALRHGVGRRR